MGVEVRCPKCHRFQAGQNTKCACKANLLGMRKRGELTFRVYGYSGKKKVRLPEVYTNLRDALDADAQRHVDKKNGQDPIQYVEYMKRPLSDLIDCYLKNEEERDVDFKTKEGRLKPVKKHLGDLIVKDIKLGDLEAYQGKRRKQGRAKSTVDKDLTECRVMINKAVDNDLISPYVQRVFAKCKRLLPKKDANRRTRYLTEEEFWRFFEHLPKHLKPVALCAIYTGMRQGEILNLTWDRVDLDRRLIYLEAKDTKEKTAKTEYIADPLLAVLRSLPRYADQNHVFLYAGKPILGNKRGRGDIRNGLRAACEKAGIPYGMKTPGGFVFHDLRRSFRRLMRKAGVDRDVIRTFTGHHSEEMDSRYNVIGDEDRREALAAMETLLEPSRHKSRHKTLN